ncbi:MAG: DUF2721 domain-containing protein [Pseudomonadota bacterium]
MNLPGMEFAQVQVGDVAHAIQLSLTPVFLLNGVGVLLSMLTTRLARIVDRARTLEERLPTSTEQGAHYIHNVLDTTRRRARLMNRAITLGSVAALLVALLVALMFAAEFVPFPMGTIIALIFIVAMLALFGSLWCFLIEVRIATETLRFSSRSNS